MLELAGLDGEARQWAGTIIATYYSLDKYGDSG